MRRPLLLLVASAVLVVAPSGAAHAHGETGFLELETAEVSGTSARYAVVLRYENDGDVVDGATMTLLATGPGGAMGPVTMTGAGDGRYEATVDFPGPGVWGVRIESTEPSAVLERTDTVATPATTAPTTTSAADEATAADDGDDGGGGGLRPASAVAAGVAAVAIVFVLRRQRDIQRANRQASQEWIERPGSPRTAADRGPDQISPWAFA